MGFAIGAYRAVEHLGGGGSGHRVSPFWRAEDTRTLEDVALAVLPVESAESVRDLIDSAGVIRHPHLLPVSDVVEDQTRVALVSPWPRGGRLTELVRRRGPLSVGETVTVLLPVAAALADLHRERVRHGWVCPEAIWFDARGRPLLGPTAVSLAVADVAGPVALGCADVAPEVFRQARSGAPGTSADVFSLGSVALFAMTGRSAWPADEPADVLVQSAAGQWPDPPDDAGSAELVSLVRSMLRIDPAARPTADVVVGRLSAGGLGDPAPIRLGSGPCPTPASSKRWRGWAGRADAEPIGAAAPDAAESGMPPPGDGPSGGQVPGDGPSDVSAADAAGVSAGPGARGEPAPGRRRGPLARLLVAVLTGLLLTVLVAQVGQWVADPPTDSADSAGPAASTDWARVVTDLDLARSRALAAGDPVLLDQVYLPGSAAGAADASMVAGLADRGLRVVDGRHDLVSVEVLDPDGTDGTRLAVVDLLAARPVLDGSGRQVAATTGRGEQRRVLVLAATDDGYRIRAIEPG
ncbi:protein kinase domain-containing protein [Nakamurella sp.]|uniref:protein kinase domain-containing protein n=1 Tax=Nakamurella sp. TaxID=1869182 RepID=UPI0037835ABD